ncbi:MAG: energy transducer TonB [Terracidiphilus sp.]|jgi:TonB family protein
MRLLCFCALSLIASLSGFAQTAANAGPGLPTDPREVFAAAAPFYDFNSPDLKPWHLKATYQLYDEKGKPTEQGIYEYWWASPTIHRSKWTRPSATHTEWRTAEGKYAHQDAGESLKFFEYKLEAAFLSPMPNSSEVSPSNSSLERKTVSFGKVKLPCIMVIPLMPKYNDLKTPPLGLFPTYCFDPQLSILRANHFFGTLTTAFNQVVKVQNKYLPREIVIFDGEKKILSAKVDSITYSSPGDPALTPPANADVAKCDAKCDKTKISAGVIQGMLLKKVTPYYPEAAKESGIAGTVVLQAVIGRDGGIHDLHVLSSPSPLLAVSALWSVSQWQYKPYLLLGEPVEVQTTINVIYSLGN